MADLKAIDAANAYANAIKNQGSTSSVGSVGSIGSLDGDADKGAFSNMVSDTLQGTSSAIDDSSSVGIQALNSNADLVDVVTTVQNAEMVLQTVVAVRDKVIAAYNDIIKMPM